jgi:hypothetical protein
MHYFIWHRNAKSDWIGIRVSPDDFPFFQEWYPITTGSLLLSGQGSHFYAIPKSIRPTRSAEVTLGIDIATFLLTTVDVRSILAVNNASKEELDAAIDTLQIFIDSKKEADQQLQDQIIAELLQNLKQLNEVQKRISRLTTKLKNLERSKRTIAHENVDQLLLERKKRWPK